MTGRWPHRYTVALASIASIGLLTLLIAVAMVALVVTDPVGTANAISTREAGPMISAIVSLMWRAFTAVIEYL
jgi:hypothetical protein